MVYSSDNDPFEEHRLSKERKARDFKRKICMYASFGMIATFGLGTGLGYILARNNNIQEQRDRVTKVTTTFSEDEESIKERINGLEGTVRSYKVKLKEKDRRISRLERYSKKQERDLEAKTAEYDALKEKFDKDQQKLHDLFGPKKEKVPPPDPDKKETRRQF